MLRGHAPFRRAVAPGEDWEKTKSKAESEKLSARDYEKPDNVVLGWEFH